MSDIVEKTLASIPSLISSGLGGNTTGAASKAFESFVNILGNVKSKYEEEQFIKREVSMQKQRLAQPDISGHQMREYLVRLVYCHMLGYDVSFAYIHAIKLAQRGTLLEKRVGYLTCSIFLHENHELVMLLINTIQKDLKSTNILEVCVALTAICQLISTEMIPALLPLVEEKLTHPKDIVRKKAVMCLHRFRCKAPSMVEHVEHHFPKALCDKDPGVMWAGLQIYHDLIQEDPSKQLHLVPTLVNILQQVMNRRLPKDFEYHHVPAPWLQIQILKLLAKFGVLQQSNSADEVYSVLKDVLQRTDPTTRIGLAVIYECLETIAAMQPHPALVDHAAKCVGKFLSAKNNSLKYLGLKALTSLVQVSSGYATEHQATVIDCLEHEDHTIKRKTLDLLYNITNKVNLEVICGHLIDFLVKANDQHFQADLVSKIIQLADQFSGSVSWHINILNQLMMQMCNLMPSNTRDKLITLVKYGSAEEPACIDSHMWAVDVYWKLLQADSVPEMAVQVGAWVLGEYSHLDSNLTSTQVVALLVEYFSRPGTTESTQAWIVSALAKVIGGVEGASQIILTLQQTVKNDDTDLRQRLGELQRLMNGSTDQVKTITQHTEQMDYTLSFLDDYVSDALEQGASPYKPKSLGQPDHIMTGENPLFTQLNFTPYEEATVRSGGSGSSTMAIDHKDVSPAQSHSSGGTGSGKDESSTSLNLKGVRKIWGKSGVVSAKDENSKLKGSGGKGEADGSSLWSSGEGMSRSSSGQSLAERQQAEQNRKQALASALFSGVASNPADTQAEVTKTTDPGMHGKLVSGTQAPTENTQLVMDSPKQNVKLDGKRAAETALNGNQASGTEEYSSDNSAEDEDFPISKQITSMYSDCSDATSDGWIYSASPQRSLLSEECSQSPRGGAGISMYSEFKMEDYEDETLTIETINNEPRLCPVSRGQNKVLGTQDSVNEHPDAKKTHKVSSGNIHDIGNFAHHAHSKETSLDLDCKYVDGREQNTGKTDVTKPFSLNELQKILLQDLKKYPQEPEEYVIGKNGCLSVRCLKVWANSCLFMVVSAQREGGSALTTAEVRLSASQGVTVKVGNVEIATTDSPPILLPDLCSDHSISLVLEVTCDQPHSEMYVKGHLAAVAESGENMSVDFQTSVTILDFMRAREISTEDFAQQWSNGASERKTTCPSKIEDLVALRNILTEACHLHCTEVIGSEALFAGTVANLAHTCLVHCKLDPGQWLEIWTRGNDDRWLAHLVQSIRAACT